MSELPANNKNLRFDIKIYDQSHIGDPQIKLKGADELTIREILKKYFG